MDPGQRVRLRPSSPVGSDWKIPSGAEGTILCRYRLLRAPRGAPDRVDVRFSPKLVVWGASSVEFEAVDETSLARY